MELSIGPCIFQGRNGRWETVRDCRISVPVRASVLSYRTAQQIIRNDGSERS